MTVHVTAARSHRLAGVLTAAVLVLAAACGSGERAAEAPPGSVQNPLVNNPAGQAASGGSAEREAASRPAPAADGDVVEQQRQKRRSSAASSRADRTNPCALVTKAQAQAILGGRLLDPYLAPQGPTCVYRSRSGASFATVAVETLDFAAVRPAIKRRERVTVSGRTAYCGVHGRPMLYLPLSRSRVLSVAAPCETALRLARRAVPLLIG